MKRGRPVGWRKRESRSYSVMIRLSPEARVWLAAEAQNANVNESDIVRQLIDERMAVARRERRRMRGATQVGHGAVVVWSLSFETHVHDLNTQFARGCVERPGGSFQRAGEMYFSWLDAPRARCELCGGRCRVR